jgi:hypothetical protein
VERKKVPKTKTEIMAKKKKKKINYQPPWLTQGQKN